MRRYSTLVIACAMVLAACGNPEEAPARSQTSTSTKPSSTRPREIKLDGKNPCELATSKQLDSLGETTAPRPATNKTLKSPECAFDTTGAGWGIVVVTTEGVEAWTNGKRQGRTTEIAPIAGFPAITVTLPGADERCDVVVDVADGQYLYTDFEVGKSFTDKFPKPCEGARQVAEAAMRNLMK